MFGTDVNGLPLSLDLSWLEQKAVIILMTLLHLNVKNIRVGPKVRLALCPLPSCAAPPHLERPLPFRLPRASRYACVCTLPSISPKPLRLPARQPRRPLTAARRRHVRSPQPPAFLTPEALAVIVDKWNLQVTDVKDPKADVAAMLAGH